MMHYSRLPILLTILMFIAFAVSAAAAPKPDLWPRWKEHNPSDTRVVDHTAWARILDKYLVTGHPSGVNRVKYAAFNRQDTQKLGDYISKLETVTVTELNREEQKAFWINLYNALVVKVVLDHYPVESIREIDISPGFFGLFGGGPWKAELVEIEGEKISLDDIEHRILRPIWRDNRIHYGMNCASIGCPNLQPKPFTAKNTDELLDKGAAEYINHPRGVKFDSENKMTASSIYDWFREDFGGTEKGVIEHLLEYSEPALARRLKSFDGSIDYHYDWSLNDFK